MDGYLRQNRECTGGPCYAYIGQLLDGYYVGASDWGMGYIVDVNPFEVNYEDIWYNEWMEKHIVRELNDHEWHLILEYWNKVG